jgi:hypothetical protein
VTRLYRSAARDHFHQHIVSNCGEIAVFDPRAKNPQRLSTLKIRVKRRLRFWWHRPAVSF